jgi:hypothetical protein
MPDQHAHAQDVELDAMRYARVEPTAAPADHASYRTAAYGLAGDRRLGMSAPVAPILHSLQRQVGNRAVVERLAIQRDGLDDFGLGDPGFGDGGGGGTTTGDGSGGGTQVISGDVIELNASSIILNAPVTRANGIMQSDAVVTDSVISSSYTPGAGNVF